MMRKNESRFGGLSRELRRNSWYYGLIAPTLIILLVINIYPLLYSVYVSLTNYKLTGVKNLRFVGLKNYIDLFSNPDFLTALRNTIIYVVCAVTTELVYGLALALLLFRLGPLGNTLLSFFLLPMMLTPVIVGIMWRFMYNYDFGMINFFLSKIGFGRVAFLSDGSRAIFYLCFVDLWQWSPYVTLLSYGALQSLPRDQIESASIDGAGAVRIFRHITLPFLSSTLWVCILVRIMDAIREYDKVYTMTMGGPGNATETASFYIYRQAFKFFKTGSASAASILLLIITIVISNIFIKRMRKNEYKN